MNKIHNETLATINRNFAQIPEWKKLWFLLRTSWSLGSDVKASIFSDIINIEQLQYPCETNDLSSERNAWKKSILEIIIEVTKAFQNMSNHLQTKTFVNLVYVATKECREELIEILVKENNEWMLKHFAA